MGTEENIKLFGMQNLLLESELKKLEESGIQIEHAKTIQRAEIVDVDLFEADIVAEGGQFLLNYACSGCHGGGGGGGMCPPLTNDIWVYGGDDDTLFRLIVLGSDELQKQGYMRKGRENVVGPMPPFGAIVKTSDDLWKILAFVRSKYSGDPAYKFGTPPDQQ